MSDGMDHNRNFMMTHTDPRVNLIGGSMNLKFTMRVQSKGDSQDGLRNCLADTRERKRTTKTSKMTDPALQLRLERKRQKDSVPVIRSALSVPESSWL